MSSPLVNQPSSSSMPTPFKKCGLLRSTPPVPTDPPSFTWKGGLFVDVFFQDAWWEAVLLDDIVTMEENTFVNVMYPEGDRAYVPVKNLRISQVWDEVTGKWINKGSCDLSRFLDRRGIAMEEIMQATSTDQDDFCQTCSGGSEAKLNNDFSAFSVAGLPGSNAAGTALQNMAYNVQARAACNGDLKDSCTDQRGHESHIFEGHLQSSLQEADLFYTSQPNDLLGDTGCVERCEAFESLNYIENGDLCSAGIDIKDGKQNVQPTAGMQQCNKNFSEAGGGAAFEPVALPLGQVGDQTGASEEQSQSNLVETYRVGTASCISQLSKSLEETRCIHRNVDESSGCIRCSNHNGKPCFDSKESKDNGKVVQVSNVMEHCSQTAFEGEAKYGLEFGLSQLVDANCGHQEPVQIPLREALSCTYPPDNLLKKLGCLCRSACEGSESSRSSAKLCSEGTGLIDSETAVNERLQNCAEASSEVGAKVGLENAGQFISGQYSTKNGIFQVSLQSAPFDIGRVDDTSFASLQSTPLDCGTVDDAYQTLEPHNVEEKTGCLRENASEGFESLKFFDSNRNQCSGDGEIAHESKAMQPCSEVVSKAEKNSVFDTARRSVCQLSNDRVTSEDPIHSTCEENSTGITTSSNYLTNNITMTRGFFRNELVGREGPQSVKSSNIYVEPNSDIALYQGNGEAVREVHASDLLLPKEEESNANLEYPVETVIESSTSQKSGLEYGESLCGKVGDSSAMPALSTTDRFQGEEDARLCVKQVCLPDMLINSSLLAEAKPSFFTPSLPICHPSEELTTNICETETGKYSSIGGGFIDCEGGSDSQKIGEEGTMNFVENNMERTIVPASWATFSSQGWAESVSEAEQDGLGCILGQSDSGGSRSPVNFFHSVTQSQQRTEESDKSDLERSVNHLNEYYCDRSKRCGRDVDSKGLRGAYSCQLSPSYKDTTCVKTQEIQATGYRMKRKATGESQERVVRTVLRDKHRSHARFLEGKIERRFDNDTLMSFRDRLVLQKRADALKKRAMEPRKVSDQGKESKKKVLIYSKQVEKDEEKDIALDKQNMIGVKPMSSLTSSVVKDKTLKLLTRDIAKEALLEAGFRIDLRPRRSRNYQDSVYVSPDGHAYWSLPKAWEALKKLQAEKPVHIDGQGSSEEISRLIGSHEKAAMSSLGGEGSKQSSLQDDRSALKEVFSRFGDDERLQSALTKRGTCTDSNLEISQNVTKQANMTNADLTDILLGDLGVLRRLTKKFLRKQRSEHSKSRDSLTPRLASADIFEEKRGSKRKQDSVTVSEVFERKILDDRGSSKKPQGICLFKSKEGKQKQASVTVSEVFEQKILDGRGSSKKSQGICLFKSKEGKKQGTIRSLKQTMLATKAAMEKDKKQGTFRSSKQTMPLTKATVAKLKNKKVEKPKGRSGLRLEVRRSSSTGSEEPACHSTRTVFAWMIDRGAVLEREKIFFLDKGNHQVVKEGVVTRDGILCSCCKRVFSVHSFEAHAGSKFSDWHQALVFTSGKRLLDGQLKAWDAEVHLRKAHNYIGISEDDTNDDTCLLCGDGGDLICCDGCPSTFHASCLQIDNIPEGDWFCPKCSCGSCGSRQCCEDKEDSNAIVCNQCEHRYHIACLHGCHSFIGEEAFCRSSCEQIFLSLRSLVGISHALPGGFSWTLLRCTEEDNVRDSIQSITQIDCHSKLAVALLVIKECFNPMVDPRTNVDMITHAMYNRWSDFDRLNYACFYTAVLENEGEIISVATIRIHGVRLAEMPLIGTREKYRRQGMCRLLVSIIEKLLSSLNVVLFVLPAIPELFDTWTLAFGFKPLDSSLKSTLKDISMMVFPGTELLQKPVALTPEKDYSPSQDAGAES
ncbi:hypothetical protein L7F22_042566 [Adiantum nelumboides]|nr:hypothetical protein [Adiantum nelumboides]